MIDMQAQYFIDELCANIQQQDQIKAAILLSYFNDMEPQVQHRVLFELSRCTSDFVAPLLGRVLANRASLGTIEPAVRSVLLEKIIDQPAVLCMLLQSPEPQDKTVFIELAASLQSEAAVPCLLSMLGTETDRHVLLSIVQALGVIGHPGATNALSDYLYADTQALVTAAVQGLAHIATPTAVQRLAERMGTDSELDRLILDALAAIPDSLALTKLNEALRSHQARVRNHAKTVLQHLGPKAVPCLLDNLRDADDADLLIHSLNVLGAIGDVSAVPPIRRLLHHEPPDANVRFAAYEALGLLPLHKGAFMLAEGLTDPVEHVRIAAAKAVERQYNDVMLAGIKNLLAQDDVQARHIVQRLAVAYLAYEAHPNLWTHFDKLLRQHGYSAVADHIETARQSRGDIGQGLIYAVDDSRMMLKIYQNTLHQLGFTSVLFEFPASVLERVQQMKPAVLLTDLNMPEMTGLELTAQLRTRYTAEELPIIMVTTQQDQQNHAAAYAAGVNAMLAKPFTAEQLEAALRRFV
jgi:CheY-like chemotaxis protein/HEAT repeat protein